MARSTVNALLEYFHCKLVCVTADLSKELICSIKDRPAPIMLENLPIHDSFENFPKFSPIILLGLAYYS